MSEPPDNRDWQISLRALMLCSVFVGAFLFINFQFDRRTAFVLDLLALLALIFSFHSISMRRIAKDGDEFKIAAGEILLGITIVLITVALFSRSDG